MGIKEEFMIKNSPSILASVLLATIIVLALIASGFDFKSFFNIKNIEKNVIAENETESDSVVSTDKDNSNCGPS